jgi:hypothetical protein
MMGFFSWRTSDTDESIPNWASTRPTFTVYMWAPDGRCFEEPAYGGYGDFGGVDYYALLSEINGGDGTRKDGLARAYADGKGGVKPPEHWPQLTRRKEKPKDFRKSPAECEYQGYFYPAEKQHTQSCERKG